MPEYTSAAEIAEHPDLRTYAYWTSKPITPDLHIYALIPQSIGDGCEIWCSCGGFYCFEPLYRYESPEELTNFLRGRWARHYADAYEAAKRSGTIFGTDFGKEVEAAYARAGADKFGQPIP
jgi:hypothetical protein